jgi:hypothetical protein
MCPPGLHVEQQDVTFWFLSQFHKRQSCAIG